MAYQYEYIPQAHLGKLSEYPGTNTPNPIYKSRHKGKDVIVKISQTNFYKDDRPFWKERVAAAERSMRNEAFWLSWLNSHGIGVPFLGFTKIDGQIGIVTELIEGTHVVLKEPSADEPSRHYVDHFNRYGISGSKKYLKEIDRIIDLLIANNVMMFDLQFMFTSTGEMHLIDAEGFQIYDPSNPNHLFTPEQLGERARTQFKRIIRAVSQ